MIIDIGAHLRRLVLAGLPLLAAGCDLPGTGVPPTWTDDPPPVAPLSAACQPRTVSQLMAPPPGARSLNIGFARTDPRVADLYAACLEKGHYCGLLCQEILTAARITLAPGHAHSPPLRCDLACDRAGQPVATIVFTSGPAPAIGRRPDGFAAELSTAPGTSLAAFFASCAALEGASIAAFTTLAAELEHHRAPSQLAARARVAARDEARHFATTARLARRFGAAPVRCPRPPARSPRDLPELARENVVEGCVNETFAAAIALWQASHAADPAVRTALATIAEEELTHAQLAWDVHRWASAQLPPADADALIRARTRAAHQLLHAATSPVDPDLVARAGLPDAPTATWLATQTATLWGPASDVV
jgi:hypothetical protein